jgi:glycosyltransferase involved in cell wall biosynthesis
MANMKYGALDLVILMPVYNDWDAASTLLEQIDSALADHNLRPLILLIDDGSATRVPDHLVRKPFHVISAVDVLRLRRNLGHQRAIAIGLTHVFQRVPCDAIMVMDSDGEDRPEDIPRLVDEFRSAGGARIIFAQRTKRMETLLFRICYRCYQILHRAMTGLGVRVGNFSIIPFHCLSALVVSPELWNHYAAAVFKLALPVGLLAAPRGRRLSGKSKMNFISLLVHGLSAISVFGEVVGTRTLIVASGLSALLIGVLSLVVAIRLFTDLAVPGWATYTSGLLLVLFVLILATTSNFLLFLLGNRNMASFLPLRDCSLYVHDIKRVYPADE